MSLRSTVLYGRWGHIFYDGYACEYRYESVGRRHITFRLPFRRPWRWLAMKKEASYARPGMATAERTNDA